MRAAVYYGNNKVEIEDVPEPAPQAVAFAASVCQLLPVSTSSHQPPGSMHVISDGVCRAQGRKTLARTEMDERTRPPISFANRRG